MASMSMEALVHTPLPEEHFVAIRDVVHRVCGINLHEGKEGLVRTRLFKRLRELEIGSWRQYVERISADASELAVMIDLLTTNKTSFFREAQHFDFLRDHVLSGMRTPPRIWSAGCSSGEEPYTLALVVSGALPSEIAARTRILATDISARILQRARNGIYPSEAVEEVPAELRRQHFAAAGTSGAWSVGPSLRQMIRFARLNLMELWPMKGPFDAVFCRNVMIYFDRDTQERLVGRFHEILAPGGHLFLGLSESLARLDHRFEYVQPAVYRKG
jgi:chemotaxis protein methyltransferase CheR